MTLLIGSVQLGVIYGLLALGIYIAFRILNVPDLTCEGSFVVGMAVSAALTSVNHPFLGLAAAVCAGCIAGIITGLLQTKCRIHPILSGILVMSGLYPINIAIMGRKPNLAIMANETVFSYAERIFPFSETASDTVTAVIFTALAVIVLALFFKTHTGLAARATGDNEDMVRASSINADRMKIIALSMANGIIALCGAIITQYQSLADINSGMGTLVLGLASVIIGEIIPFKKGITFGFISAVIGSVIYRFIIAIAMKLPFFDAGYLKLVSAVIVIIALSVPEIKRRTGILRSKRRGAENA